ncbi:hypothetical protein [Magnetovibrio blakemorei]|uniref:Uncharacterized protein n=1 Tax=Magnetovibrio blakemorei TaxID=28181 RepID=A0A1E5Q827_9PROT|nr:hypothetical protein [Magnetovibrio blakemorei]OEJ67192.1 hypothetical protein BEN30_10510 [Magnetovibrio blakemorei]
MRCTPELEKLLYRVIDSFDHDDRPIHRIHTSQWDAIEIEVRPFTLCLSFDGDDMIAPRVQSIARIEGKMQGQPFLALLQVYRSESDCRDIVEIAWHSDDPDLVRRWIVMFQLKGKPGLLPEPVKSSIPAGIKHCWAWDHAFIINANATAAMTGFSEWINSTIPRSVQEFYLGGEVVDADDIYRIGMDLGKDQFFWCGYSLCDLTPESWADTIAGQITKMPGSLRFKSVDLPSLLAINWFIGGAIRLRNIEIHSYHDDQELGRRPLSPAMRDRLEQAQNDLLEWLERRWLDRLPILLDRIQWNQYPKTEFYKDIKHHDAQRLPVAQVDAPSIGWFLPYPQQ